MDSNISYRNTILTIRDYVLIFTTLLLSSTSYAETSLPQDIFKEITIGWAHTCGLTSDNGVKCWGDNRFYQLGDGTNTNRPSPVNVTSLEHGVVAISGGKMHTCALLKTGTVRCWGISGKQGDGTSYQQTVPVEVAGLKDVRAISAGDTHTCALTNQGAVKCWGDNYSGKLGVNPDQDGLAPVNVNISEKAIAISAGMFHTCALTAANVFCWGDNYFGQLGNKTKINSFTPVVVGGLNKTLKLISAGDYHTCALAESGEVQCWGYNKFGQLGNGNTAVHSGAVSVNGLPEDIVSIVSSQHSCALTRNGDVKCWGYNKSGQVGDNTTQNQPTPKDVRKLSNVIYMAVGKNNSCAVKASGEIQCWGQLDSTSDNTAGLAERTHQTSNSIQ